MATRHGGSTARTASIAAGRTDTREDLVVRDLTVAYGKVRGLEGVSVEVPAGSAVALIGANGAGKSTLIRAVTGCLPLLGGRVTAGSATFAGQDVLGKDAAAIARAGVVHVPEGRRVFTKLTVEENLRVAGLALGDRTLRASARSQVLELFPVLADRSSQKAGLLSGGEQQMLAIGRGLMLAPRLLVLDEPSLGLAPTVVERIADAIRNIRATGLSLLLVEQNATLALELAERAYVLEIGSVSLAGRSEEIAASPQVRELYLGGSAGRAGALPTFAGTLARWQR